MSSCSDHRVPSTAFMYERHQHACTSPFHTNVLGKHQEGAKRAESQHLGIWAKDGRTYCFEIDGTSKAENDDERGAGGGAEEIPGPSHQGRSRSSSDAYKAAPEHLREPSSVSSGAAATDRVRSVNLRNAANW